MKAYIKMEKVIKFGDIQIQKQKFHQHKGPILIKNIDSNKIVVSNKVSNISSATKDAKKHWTFCIYLF